MTDREKELHRLNFLEELNDCLKILEYELYELEGNNDEGVKTEIKRNVLKFSLEYKEYLSVAIDEISNFWEKHMKAWGKNIKENGWEFRNFTYIKRSMDIFLNKLRLEYDLPITKELPMTIFADSTAEAATEEEPPTDSTAEADKPKDLELPEIVGTDRARKYFARAIDAGFMELTENGAKWLLEQVKLAYFCSRIYDSPRPISDLEKFFNIRGLSALISQVTVNEPKRADVVKWRNDIDKKIFFN